MAAKLTREQREELAAKRLLSVLKAHTIANARTLEQKISDGGPYGQRIDPHVLTPVRNSLVQEGRLVAVMHDNAPWFHRADALPSKVQARLAEQLVAYRAFNSGNLSQRFGQTLEIATYRALLLGSMNEFHGRFRDLNDHGDGTLYSKEDPPQHIGNRHLVGQERLDFLVRHPSAGYLGIECKNVRPWLYPHDDDIVEALRKCIALDAVPVLIGRRIPYSTFAVLSACGVIMHQTFNQLLPAADEQTANLAKDKNLLGYHDIRLGNEPDARLLHFITENLKAIADNARAKFNDYYDLLYHYSEGYMQYEAFAARVRRRTNGLDEDFDRE